MLELNRLEIMAGALKLVAADLDGKNLDFSAHVVGLVLGDLEREISAQKLADVPVLDCGDCIAIFKMNGIFGLDPEPCAPCTAAGIFITKGTI